MGNEREGNTGRHHLLIGLILLAVLPAADRCVQGRPSPPDGEGAGGCETPPDAVVVRAGESIQAAVDSHPEGTSFLLKAGVHRLQQISPKAGDAFYGERDAECARWTILTGARLLTQFERSEDFYVAPGQTQEGQATGTCEEGARRCYRPEDLYFDDVPLQHVASLGEVGPGRWYFDYQEDKVYFADDPEGHGVEISVTRSAFVPEAPSVKIHGLIVEKYATPAQVGAIGDRLPNVAWHIEDNEVRLNHGTGIRVYTDSRVLNNVVHRNGQLGIDAAGADVLIQDNEIFDNNFAGFLSAWEAGGAKFSFTTRLTVRDNCVHDNRGSGLWTDIDNVHSLYEGNVVFRNRDQGIFHEISHDAVIRDNWVGQNGEDTRWLYGANILVATSNDVEVYGNRVEVAADYGNAIAVIWQDRSGEGGDYEATGNDVHDNEITFLGLRGLAGVGADFDPAWTLAFESNVFDHNTYHLRDLRQAHFAWDNTEGPLSWFQARGQEALGQVDADAVPLEWRCDMR